MPADYRDNAPIRAGSTDDDAEMRSEVMELTRRVERLEAELATLREAPSEGATSVPATLPSDSTTLPARVPAP